MQEEVGCRGASPASFSIHPNLGFAIDVGFATDTPDINVKQFGVAKLGKGPILHRNADNNSVLGKLLREITKKKKIEYQEDAGFRASGGTDTAVIQLTKSGVATALISIPNRYMHTQVEMVDLKDVEGAVKLLSQTILAINPEQSFIPA